MDFSREKIEVFEVDENGKRIENYNWDAYEINDALNDGRNIVQHGWHNKRLFNPVWDFEREEWIEGLSTEEIEKREQEIAEQENTPTEIERLEMALMELAIYTMSGGKGG